MSYSLNPPTVRQFGQKIGTREATDFQNSTKIHSTKLPANLHNNLQPLQEPPSIVFF